MIRLPKNLSRETRISLALAVVCMAGLGLLSGTVVLLDVGTLRKQVERLFSIELDPSVAKLEPTKYVEGAVEEFAQSVLKNGEGAMFSSLGNAPAETPGRALRPESPSAAMERQKTDDIPSPSLPNAEQPLVMLEQQAIRQEGPKIATADALRSVQRKPMAGAEGELAGGGSKTAENPDSVMRANRGLSVDVGTAPAPVKMPEPSRQDMPLPSETPIPDSAVTMTRRLLDERPPEGYPSLDQEIAAVFEVYRREGEEDAFFRLTLSVKPDSRVATMPKDVFFLVDVSQSIGGAELSAAREAVVRSLKLLAPEDRWNVAVFSESEHVMHPSFVAASALNEEAVRAFVARRAGERQTDVFRATRLILSGVPESTRPCNVFLLSDGKATSGTGDVRRIVQDFRRDNRENFSIFTYNAGARANRYLLQLLSYRSRGFFSDCSDLAQVPVDFEAFALRYARPVLSHTVASYTNIQGDHVVPQVLPNLYRDAPITFWGRTRPGKVVTLRVAGLGDDGKPREFFFRAEIPEGKPEQAVIAQEWARGRANLLMAELADDPKNKELRAELDGLAKKYELSDVAEILGGSRWLPW